MSQDHSRPGVPAAPYGYSTPAVWSPTDTLVRAGVMGAVVGAAGAVASEYGKVRAGETTKEAAVRDVALTAGKVGVATGLGALVAGALRGGPVVSAVAMVATGAAALHVMDGRKRPVDTAAAATPAKKD